MNSGGRLRKRNLPPEFVFFVFQEILPNGLG